jgi:hypothetical protein
MLGRSTGRAALVAAACALGAGGCQTGAEEQGQAESFQTEAPDGKAVGAAELAEMLSGEGAFVIPAYAKKLDSGVGDLEASAKLVTVTSPEGPGDLGRLVEPLVVDIAKDFVDEPAEASLFRIVSLEGDTHFDTKFGWNDTAIRKYLVSVVDKSRRAKVKKALFDPDFHAHYFWLNLYDNGSELVGHDLIVVMPFAAFNQPHHAIVIQLFYVAA